MASKKSFLLVHGAWHGAWCWHKVEKLLQENGCQVVVPDLFGLGANEAPLAKVTLASWVEQLRLLVAETGSPANLVGHSRAGIVISQFAEWYPEQVASLIYVSGIVPRNGESMFDLTERIEESELSGAISVDEERGSYSIDPIAAGHVLYNGCPDEDIALAATRLKPEPIAPSATPLVLTEKNFQEVQKSYIGCLQDRALTPLAQQGICSDLGTDAVVEMNSGHSPFFSDADELVQHFMALAH